MSATNLIFNTPVSPFKQVPGGDFNMTPTIGATHAAADTFQFYLGGFPTSQIDPNYINMVLDVPGSAAITVALTLNADGVSATYTATGSEAWLAVGKVGVTYQVYVEAGLLASAYTSKPGDVPFWMRSGTVSFAVV
jgi:hypothetical protein